jgi:hypothetical protein
LEKLVLDMASFHDNEVVENSGEKDMHKFGSEKGYFLFIYSIATPAPACIRNFWDGR